MTANLSGAATAVLSAVAAALVPPPDTSISDWVDTGPIILTARTNTPKEGPLSFEGVEYLREPVDRLHPDDAATRVTIRGGAQSAKSTVGQMWVCWTVENAPRSFAIGLPSAGEMTKYNDLKLEPLLDDSPRLKDRIDRRVVRGKPMSDSKKKTLVTGATLRLFNLASPKELQMISTGNLILEEVGNALVEVGTRGSPVAQARERQAAYSVVGSKELMVSTPSIVGECEVTKAEEAGDQRRYYGRCPNCDGYFRLEPEEFRCSDLNGTPNHFVCPPNQGGCGGVLEESDMSAFRLGGAWVPTFISETPELNPQPDRFISAEQLESFRLRNTEGREPSYYIWQAYCGLISWAKIAKSITDAKSPADLKTLEQQTFGRAWDPAVESVAWEDLHRLREPYEHLTVPSGAELVTAFTDVQGGYLEGGAIAWGPGGEWWVVERWVIDGDTAGDEVWFRLDEIYRRTYAHADGGIVPIEAFGVDTGFRTQRVYSFCRGRERAFAMDGRPGWKLPIIGRPSMQKVIERGKTKGRVKLWPTGTWELKSMLAWSLKLSTEAGYQVRQQGRGHWSMYEDEAWAQQITAEGLVEEKNKRTGNVDRWWKKLRERNEWTDIWVGARALAWNLGVGAPAKDGRPEGTDWAQRALDRRGPDAEPTDLFTASPAGAPHAPASEALPSPADHTDEPGLSRGRFYRSRRR
ncbi:terminase gpA endonuclease subunit [Brevundimonas sp.]|uniref:terminase gpA endonuclease subunit n=1 Tax=Brevundimonas sp. TaxID=1871086 RepID=UPI0028A0300E|nr:terminase gpA endonuclease subunit [Brevundimonas sp.]